MYCYFQSSPGASTPKEADSPTTGSYVPAQPENDKSSSVNTPEEEQDPLLLPEKEKTSAPEPVMFFSYLMIFVM